ncbi:phosphotransferase family protein [Streptomyces fuscigenes]|uniref:phosphotransferase family protein n=1 Tax=Streptomyces fuscigenes TaxID=1528880 RepID=UPI001F2E8AE5|nr:aminoglycoside phosphotransferase family protein [Streptomyces fuscigenes]MCF3963289.1 aminoglycoside phosphotransferase family protein [Streptomyces fuscigenes]
MTPVTWSTHSVELRPDRVVKTFRPGSEEEGAREWRALSLLATFASGLAPAPLSAQPTGAEPVVVMTRLPGRPLRGEPLDGRQTAALAATLTELYAAVPADVLAGVPVRPDDRHELLDRIRKWTPQVRPAAGPEVAEAIDRGLAWLDGSGLERPGWRSLVPVFGPGDGNLANYLWDGSRVRIVDFEDSGRSERAFELAEITEHVGAWIDGGLDADAFLARFDLGAAERERLDLYRRLLALVWLFLLSLDDPAHPRNPPGTAERQAARLCRLLG